MLRVNRRLMTILLPLATAALAAGCTTFSDNDAVARVGDVELSEEELDDLFDEQEVPDDQRDDLNIARTAISGWIESTAVDEGLFSADLVQEIPDDELVALYRQGMEAAGVTCARLLVAPSLAEAEDAAERLAVGEEFAEVFAELNVDPTLADVDGEAGCFDINQVLGEGEPPPEVRALLSVNENNPIATAPSSSADGGEVGLLIQYRPAEDLPEEDLAQVLDLIRQSSGVGLVLDGIDIHVDSRYGRFDRATGSVVPLG